MRKISLGGPIPKGPIPSYLDKNIALCDDLSNLSSDFSPILMNCFILVVVKSGSASFQIDNKVYQIQKNDLFACKPQNMIVGNEISADFNAITFVVSPDYTLNIIRETQINFNLPLLETSHEIMHITDDESNVISQMYHTLNALYHMSNSRYNRFAIECLLKSLAYKCVEIFNQYDGERIKQPYTSSKNIFREFFLLINANDRPILNVSEYAELLHITPKYFSAVCKSITGKTANQIITEQIISRAKVLLLDDSLNIKQIASKLNFQNQSHFGTFFRRETGMSPQAYRQQLEQTME